MMITRSLNPQALAIEDCETIIKQIILKGYLQGKPKHIIQQEIKDVIKKTKAKLKSPPLIDSIDKSMFLLADKIWAVLIISLGNDGKRTQENITIATQQKIVQTKRTPFYDYDNQAVGVANDKYSKIYLQDVKEVFNQLEKTNALDLDDTTGRNSLRNKAEMVVRYEYHQQQEDDFRAKGINLVVCSVHADCSKRCAPYQGRIYSLDGTRGRTPDGREYVPLEEATQNPRDLYTTKSGRTYQNGLFGFNCRHRLYEYKDGMAIPKVSEARRKREDYTNQRQREYESNIRTHKQMALFYRTSGQMEEYSKEREIAIRLNKRYIAFSKRNDRAYYPDRTKIFS